MCCVRVVAYTWHIVLPLLEGRYTGQFVGNDQLVDVVHTFVGINTLQVHHVTTTLILICDAIGTQYISCNACTVEAQSERYSSLPSTPE